MKPINAAGYRAATFELARACHPRTIVEVGVYAGELSRLLSAIDTVDRYYIVDSWAAGYSKLSKAHMDAIADGVLAWASTIPKITVLRVDSAVAASYFEDESIDFFHTDGDHSPEGIRADIRNWMPKVRPGGILSGDNYESDSVSGGVDELLPARQIGAKGRLWWFLK